MISTVFLNLLNKYQSEFLRFKYAAYALHKHVNQTYDQRPYGVHLEMVAEYVRKYGHLVCATESDLVPMVFAAYFHDSIEDARLTYNNVMQIAKDCMTEEQALMAAEIVYALTNNKGRTRAERANDAYYEGIRTTPYAPFTKMADRLANVSYSFSHDNEANIHMREVYASEYEHFVNSITAESADPRCTIPQEMTAELGRIITEPDGVAKELWAYLHSKKIVGIKREWTSLGDGMTVVSEAIGEWNKPRFLLDNKTQCAYEFTNSSELLMTVTHDDIDWDSIRMLKEDVKEVAKNLDAHYPTRINQFENGKAVVEWQLNPNGYYYMDSDGFGMTNDVEITLHGIINKKGRVVEKFRNIRNWEEVEDMQAQAQSKRKG